MERPFNLPESTLGERKYIFATYAEMAMHNYFITLQYIYERSMEKVFPFPEDKKHDYDYDMTNTETWNNVFDKMETAELEHKSKAIELFYKHFPFVEPFVDNYRKLAEKKGKDRNWLDPEAREKSENEFVFFSLRRVHSCIYAFRNAYSHKTITPSEKQIEIFDTAANGTLYCLKNCYDGARRIVKQRFDFSDQELERTNRYKKDDDKGNYIENHQFRYIMSSYEKSKNKLIFAEFGVIALISLLLEKSQINNFINAVHYVEKEDRDIIFEILSVYRIKLPQNKLECSSGTTVLALDMLNELRKCPKVLFNMLQPEKQKEFHIKESDGENEVLMIRHRDRFAELMMKYIDCAKLFKGIRFQVHLGKYFFRFYNKTCVDSMERVWALSKDVNGFGRLDEIEQLRNKRWEDKIRKDIRKQSVDDSDYVTDHRASYVFNGNRIGLRIFDSESESGNVIPELKPDGVKNVAPTCWMSIYEIVPMGFLMHLCSAKAVEKIIKECVNNYKRLFKDIEQGTLLPVASEDALNDKLSENYGGLSSKDIPSKLCDYLTGRNVNIMDRFNNRAEELLRDMCSKTEEQKNHLEEREERANDTKNNKIGKKSFVTIKSGDIAKWMAKDIMRFQPEGKGKLTSVNFNIMQSMLALFSRFEDSVTLDDIKRMFVSAGIIGNDNKEHDNPIVSTLNFAPAIEDLNGLYKEYLKKRKEFIDKCKNEKMYSSYEFLHPDRSKWQERTDKYYRDLAGRYFRESEMGMELPRGLFEKRIREELSKTDQLKDLAFDSTKNLSYLITAYLKSQNDESQSFYTAKRKYKLFHVLGEKYDKYYTQKDIYESITRISGRRNIDDVIRNSLREADKSKNKADFKKRLKQLFRNMKKTETELKQYRTEDIVLFFTAKGILSSGNMSESEKVQREAFNKMKLNQVTNGNILNQEVTIDVKVPLKDGEEKTIRKEGLKLKNYSNVFHILYDRRLPSLLSLVDDSQIEMEDIEGELHGYDRAHPEVMKTVLKTEQEFYESHPNEPSLGFSKMVQKMNLNPDEQKAVTGIRNSFAHSSYPTSTYSKKEPMPNKATKIKDEFEATLGRGGKGKKE